MKTAKEILKGKLIDADYKIQIRKSNGILVHVSVINLMEEYAEQFKYDYSQSCKCTDSPGSTWCCNICGKPLDNNSPSNAEVKIIEKMQAMCIESLSPDTFEKWEIVKEWLIKNRNIK
jgi:hypothetical protein